MVTSRVLGRTCRPRSARGLVGAGALAGLAVALTTGTARAQSIYVQGPPPPPPPPPPQYYGPPPGQYYGPPPPRYAYYAPDYEPPQALALGFDLEGAFPVNLPVIDGNTIQGGGGGFKVRIGEQFHLRPRLRITPEAGSFQSTRSSRRAASFVPSATITMPACCEKPMPTPPPWWIDTQVAPEAQLRSALRSGQSETASEPSRIASVSRLGEATEPESRWSRPMTIGALSSPEATISLKASPSR